MIWGLNSQSDKQKIIISLTESDVRLFLLENSANNLQVVSSHFVSYQSLDQLETECNQWLQQIKAKKIDCHWLLSRSLYKTIAVKPPKVPNAELDNAIKWLVKDQVDQPLDNLLVSHYQPESPEQGAEKLSAVIADKRLIEKLLDITQSNNLNIVSILIDELSAGNALTEKLEAEKITGFIDQDKNGLIYNFYIGKELAFTRHIKGRFFPNQQGSPFTLESDAEEQLDRFLLETQRTLDYCVSQVFRKPVDSLIVDAAKIVEEKTISSLEQITELPVQSFSLELSSEKDGDAKDALSSLSISEAGSILRSNTSKQSVNFYLPQYQPKPLEYGFKFAASITLIFTFGFVCYGLLQQKEIRELERQLAQETLAVKSITNEMNKISAGLGQESSLENINNIIAKKQKTLASTQKLLLQVNEKAPLEPVRYSQVLSALATQKSESLWLTQISIFPTSISLTGTTTNAESVPNYIDEMSKNKILSSQFEELIIERDQESKQLINFQMTNGKFNNAR